MKLPWRRSIPSLTRSATKAFRAAHFTKALRFYEQLEKREPRDGLWSQRVAEMHRRLGGLPQEIAALGRAADRFAAAGEPVKAIAACKLILAVDPQDNRARDRLAALYAKQGLPNSAPAAGEASGPGSCEPIELAQGAAIDEILLTSVIPGAGPASETQSGRHHGAGVSDIPLDPRRALTSPRMPGARGAEPASVLPVSPLFEKLGEARLRRIIDAVRFVPLAEGEELFHQGDAGDALYIIAEGAAVPIAEGPVRKKLAVLERGDFFGEIALVTQQPRNATIEALVDTQLLALDRGVVAELVRDEPAVLQVLLRFVRDRLIDRLMHTSPIFEPLPAPQRALLGQQFRFLEISDGAIVLRQGETSDALFVLLAGSMEVIRSDTDCDRSLASLKVGDVFGEMSLLTGEPVTASVVAQGKSWVLALPGDFVRRVLDGDPQMRDAIEETARERAHANELRSGSSVYIDDSLDLI